MLGFNQLNHLQISKVKHTGIFPVDFVRKLTAYFCPLQLVKKTRLKKLGSAIYTDSAPNTIPSPLFFFFPLCRHFLLGRVIQSCCCSPSLCQFVLGDEVCNNHPTLPVTKIRKLPLLLVLFVSRSPPFKICIGEFQKIFN